MNLLRLNRDRTADMGMVLSFSPRAAAGNRHRQSGELASVIIFPGVRYERLEQEPRSAADAAAPREPSPGKSAH